MSAYYACDDCGEPFTIEQGQEPRGERTPCPVCGGTSRELGVRVETAEVAAKASDATVRVEED